MSTITRKQPVTFSVDEAERLFQLLSDFASSSSSHARATKSAAIRAHCDTRAEHARTLADAIVRRLYDTTSDTFDPLQHSIRCTAEQCDCEQAS